MKTPAKLRVVPFFCIIFSSIKVLALSQEKASQPFEIPPSIITVTIELYWDVASVGKPIPAPYTTQVTDGTLLLDIINKAADDEREGPFNKYASTYYGGLGYFITAFNGTEQDPATSTYWMIYDKKTGELLKVGVSQYKPKDGSVTVFTYEKITGERTHGEL